MPIEIEGLVAKELGNALRGVVAEKLGQYGGPLHKCVDEVVLQNQAAIKALLTEAIKDAVTQEQFRAEIKSAFVHTLARSLMNEFKGEVEKQANALRQQADFRARVVLSIERIVSETREQDVAAK